MPLSKRRPRKDDDDQVIKVNPTVNAIFTSVFLAQVVGTFAALFLSLGVVTGHGRKDLHIWRARHAEDRSTKVTDTRMHFFDYYLFPYPH